MNARQIQSDAELFRCFLFQTPILIELDEGTVYLSVINGLDDEIIYVEGGFEFRSNITLYRKEFSSDADLENCIWFQTPVELRIDGRLHDVILINAVMDDFILVDGAYYFRSDTVVLAA